MAAAARKSQSASPSAAARLDVARTDHAAASSKLNELEAARHAALLADQDSEAANLAAEIEQQRRLLRGFQDKAKLLQEEVQKEEQARRTKEREELIVRIEKKFADRDAAAAELSDAIRKADAAFRKMIDAGQAVLAAWPWQSHDTHAVLLSTGAITSVVAHELYKTGARPRRFGGMDQPGDGLNFPGGRCPDLRLANLQEKIKPLTAVCAEASALASTIMRTGRSTSHPEPAVAHDMVVDANGQGEPSPRSEAERRLGELWRRQAQLAEDPAADEQEYQAVVAAIAQAQTEIDAARRIEQ
jgi:hypothetical protein